MERWLGSPPPIEIDPSELVAPNRRAPVPTHPRFAALMLAVITALAPVACAPAESELAGRQFIVGTVTEGGASKPLPPGRQIRLAFVGATLSVFDGCHTIGASYRVDRDRLVADLTGTSATGCVAEDQSHDVWLERFLVSRPTIRLIGAELTLDNGAITIRLLDSDLVEPDLNLVGPTWTVEVIVDGDETINVRNGPIASLIFKGDGTVDVATGCNRGSGTWKLEAEGVAITDVGLTKMASDGAAGALEVAMLRVLGAGTVATVIDGNILTLAGGGVGLQLRDAGAQPGAAGPPLGPARPAAGRESHALW